MRGENFVILMGKITYPSFKELDNDNYMFKAKLAIPSPDDCGLFQYIKIGAWGNLAEALSVLPKDSYVRIHGHIEESSYDGQCRYCKGSDKKYWTEIIVDNFILI